MRSIDGLKIRNSSSASNGVYKKTVPQKTLASVNTSFKPKVVVTKNKSSSVSSTDTNINTDINIKTDNIEKNNKEESHRKEDSKVTRQSNEEFLRPVKNYDFDLNSKDVEKEKKLQEQFNKDRKKQTKKDKKKKKKISGFRKFITTFLLIIVLGIYGVLIWGFIWGNDLIAKITGGSGDLFQAITILTSDRHVDLKMDENGRTNILMFGTSGFSMKGEDYDGVEHDGAALTDSIMVVSFDQKTKDIALVSLPRDLKAGATCTATGKINEVYWCNNMYDEDEESGAMALAQKMDEILGVNIQYYVHVNWGALATAVDALGGITVTLDEDIVDEDYTGAVFEAGVPYTLNGEDALALARARHGTMGGDFSRGASQQKILIGIKDKIYTDGLGWTTALSLISTLGDNLRTNVNLEEMKSALWMVGDMDLNNIRQVPLVDYGKGIYYVTTAYINDISYVIPSAGEDNYYQLKSYIKESFTTPEPEAEQEVVEPAEETE